MTELRRMVLSSFKKLHRTRLKVFSGDERALTAARVKINEEYNKHKHIDNEDAIRAMIKYGEDVETELRTQVIQAKEVRPGVFEAKISEETVKLENVPFNDNAIPDEGIKGSRQCCMDQAKNN